MADLAGVHAKFRRAEHHLNDFDAMFDAFLAQGPYALTFHFDEGSGWHTWSWDVKAEPPSEELALVFADFLNDLRSALDYLVWQLVLAAGNSPTRHTMFPIVASGKEWNRLSKERIKGVHPTWANVIRQCQPYHLGAQWKTHPLYILDFANNVNKHRLLPPLVMNVYEFYANFRTLAEGPGSTQMEVQSFNHEPIRHGGEAFRLRSPGGERVEASVDRAPRFSITFDEGLGFAWSGRHVLDAVRSTVALFEPAFRDA